ncbi:MAG: tetratricopeptide repeat protein [SAR324 cluster bacterium]|nr:tetratricopeptide repeat protein [SAR324 cluster bacterium]MCZ6646255.1 tetratricopeptide repeat protein [SAR324 cluster bacterium]MCZ6842079.1 tetratricopeptide repeat protein [SAR324 cluster bacterium]
MKQHATFLTAIIAGLVMLAPLAIAAGTASSSKPPVTSYSKGVRAVQGGDFRSAIVLLERAVARDGRNADAYNYLGFSYRKLGKLDTALKHYRKALEIDPKHKGAHEYIGETHLQQNELGKAKKHLARLDKICWLGCEEYDDLKAAIKKYESK